MSFLSIIQLVTLNALSDLSIPLPRLPANWTLLLHTGKTCPNYLFLELLNKLVCRLSITIYSSEMIVL